MTHKRKRQGPGKKNKRRRGGGGGATGRSSTVIGNVMIRCPITGRAIPTGVVMSEASFRSSVFTGNSVSCPACGGVHPFDSGNAWVETS
jgi:hypothetical protein